MGRAYMDQGGMDPRCQVDAAPDCESAVRSPPVDPRIQITRAVVMNHTASESRGMASFAVEAAHSAVDEGGAVAPSWVVHIVDDDAAVRNALKFTFELDGFDVRTYGGFHDLMAADLPRCGCMIVDYNLPEINGLELLRELDRRDVRLPSFLITSNPSRNVQMRATAQGVAIIEKPLLGNQLSEAVRDSFARAWPC